MCAEEWCEHTWEDWRGERLEKFYEAVRLVLEGACPRCEQPLERREIGGTPVGYCTRCHGAWSVETHRHDADCHGGGCPFDANEVLLSSHGVPVGGL